MNGILTPTLPPGLGVLAIHPLSNVLRAWCRRVAPRGRACCWPHTPVVPGTLPGQPPGCLCQAHAGDVEGDLPLSVVDEGAAALSPLLCPIEEPRRAVAWAELRMLGEETAEPAAGKRRPGSTLRTPNQTGTSDSQPRLRSRLDAPLAPKVLHPLGKPHPHLAGHTWPYLPGPVSFPTVLVFFCWNSHPPKRPPRPHQGSPQPTTPTLGING